MKAEIFLGLFVLSLAHFHFEIEPIDMAKTKLTVDEKWFDNFIDHFRKVQLGTYKQRYWEMMNYWDPHAPKAILYICGESEGRFPREETLPVVAALEARAAVFSLEHRFYGKSQPVVDWSVKNLALLTHQQGLADIAYFIESKNRELKEKHGVSPKWVVIGGSYAGAMSAWFRYKYPHLAAGSISSSGVVNAIDDFQDYEKQVIMGLIKCGVEYTKQLRDYQIYADEILYGDSDENRERFLKLFKAEGMKVLDFQYYFADIPVAWVQGGKRNELCEILKKIKDQGEIENQIGKLAEAARNIGHTVDSYKLDTLKDETIDATKHSRQWYYQVCTSFGWFQTAYVENPIRSLTLNLTYWKEYCAEIYPEAGIFPNVALTNSYMGGVAIEKHASNIFFTQGMDDGWKWAGLMGDREHDQIIVKEITCDDCAHCVDLKVPSEKDAEVLKETRKMEIKMIKTWLLP